MRVRLIPRRLLASVIVLPLLLLLALPAAALAQSNAGSQGFYQQTNLVSDIAGVAKFTDSNLVNPWGLVHAPQSPWWVADNGTGVSTLYNGHGVKVPLTVTIPPPGGSPAGTTAAPTGTIFNGTSGFVVSENGKSGSALFIFATEDGTISGWNPNVDPTNAVLAVDRSTVGAGAVYKGLAIGSNANGTFLFATNFRFGTVEKFNSNFKLVKSFTDPNVPNGYAPFGIQSNGGNLLYVTFALQNAQKHDDVAGPGNGFVNVFDTNGHLLRRFASRGALNSPWGVTRASFAFGRFSGDILVGNFGDGEISAFDSDGHFLGTLKDSENHPIVIDGLWTLTLGGGRTSSSDTLYFTAGPNGETNGLFGTITPVPTHD